MNYPLSTAMRALLKAQIDAADAIRCAVSIDGADVVGLRRLGVDRAEAEAAAKKYRRTSPPSESGVLMCSAPPMPDAAREITAVVASRARSKEQSGRYGAAYMMDRHRLMVRHAELKLPVWLEASHIATDVDGEIGLMYPIVAHLFAADSTAASRHPLVATHAPEFAEDDNVCDGWSEPCDVYLLGTPEQLKVTLPPGVGIAGTRHYYADDLRSATRLDAVMTVNQIAKAKP